MDDITKNFDYAVIEVIHRLNINKPINFETIILDKVIRTNIEHRCNANGSKHWSEFQVLYRDSNNKVQCSHFDIKEYSFKILKIGNSLLNI